MDIKLLCFEHSTFFSFFFAIPSRLCSDTVEIFPASQLANPCVYTGHPRAKSRCMAEVATVKRCVVHGVLPLGACTLEVAVIRSNRPIIGDYVIRGDSFN